MGRLTKSLYEQRSEASDILEASYDIIHNARLRNVSKTSTGASIILSEYVDHLIEIKEVLHQRTLEAIRQGNY